MLSQPRVAHQFIDAARDGNLGLVQRLLRSGSVKPGDVHVLQDNAFRRACRNGRVDVARFLLEWCDTHPTCGPVDAHAMDDYAFQYACQNGHGDVARLLLAWCAVHPPQIDIHAMSVNPSLGGFNGRDIAFVNLHRHGHVADSRWLWEWSARHSSSRIAEFAINSAFDFSRTELHQRWIRTRTGPPWRFLVDVRSAHAAFVAACLWRAQRLFDVMTLNTPTKRRRSAKKFYMDV